MPGFGQDLGSSQLASCSWPRTPDEVGLGAYRV